MITLEQARDRVAALAAEQPQQWPSIHAITQQDDIWQLSLGIDASITWLEGHFPDKPVLPGVVQVHWAGLFGQTLFEPVGTFSAMDNVKFQNMILPDRHVDLQLQFDAAKSQLRFYYGIDDTVCSEGRLQFKGPTSG